MIEIDELNEIATLLHVTSEIATNHPNCAAISRACQRRLAEINAELVDAEVKEVEANKQAAADRQAKAYVPPKEGDPNYIAPEKPAEEKPIYGANESVEVERRV